MVIREMSEGDIGACVDLSNRVRRESWEKFEKELYPQYLFEEELKQYSDETLSRFIKSDNSFAFVSVDKSEVMGLAMGRVNEGGLVDLSWICVDPLARGKGIGKKLINKVVEYSKSKGCHKIFAYTFPAIAPTVSFYLRCGFVPEAYFRKHWYGLDFVMMSKWLE
ncbi:MAG: GNAT family N-acetyltransferase [Candidatus Zixiibacteriota bacterium]